MINKLKDMAELAMAAYRYFHLANPKYDFNKNSTDTERLKYFRELKDELIKQNPNTADQELQNTYPTPADILNIEHKYFKDEKTGKLKDGFFDDKLFDGEFTPTQAKRFSERYELIHHIPNTLSGFSATIFYDIKESNTTTNTKEFKKHFEYIIAFRGTESTEEIA